MLWCRADEIVPMPAEMLTDNAVQSGQGMSGDDAVAGLTPRTQAEMFENQKGVSVVATLAKHLWHTDLRTGGECLQAVGFSSE